MQDEIWKVSVSKYFKDFCEFFLSDLNEYIDHSKGYTFLESELEKILLEAEAEIVNSLRQIPMRN
jgi:hypothetical protein